jgi:response regulator RpfG family c-di-GMP phosphodiesterase
MENVNSVTNITLITNSGKELYLKVSGSILNERNHFFLKLFNLTSEIIITKKFANLKNKFDQLLKLETEDMIKTSDSVIIETLKFFENKDEDFGNHLERISEYSLIIAKDIFYNNSLNEDIDLDYINVLPRASALHDIGMLSIKESILFKDSKLTQEEFTIVKNHTIVAANMIDQLIKDYSNSTFLKLLKEITLGHHERYDGSGYPYKLEGKQIPLSARIVAFADIFDGLTTDRIYKKGLDLDIARMMIVDYKGKLIDPDIVEIYLKNEEKFIEIHKKYKNT